MGIPFSLVALSLMSSKQRFVSSKIVCRRLEWLQNRLTADAGEAVMVFPCSNCCFSSQPQRLKSGISPQLLPSRGRQLVSTGVVVMSSTLKMANVVVASVGKGLSAEIKKLIGPAKVVNIEIDDNNGTKV